MSTRGEPCSCDEALELRAMLKDVSGFGLRMEHRAKAAEERVRVLEARIQQQARIAGDMHRMHAERESALERDREALREQSEFWRRAHNQWQVWAATLLQRLGMQPPGGQHGDAPARDLLERNQLTPEQARVLRECNDADLFTASGSGKTLIQSESEGRIVSAILALRAAEANERTETDDQD